MPRLDLLSPSTTIFFLILLDAMTAATFSADLNTLLTFKAKISDPSNALESWDITNTTVHFCQWRGVTCGGRHPDKVTSLKLRNLTLTAKSLPPHVANLTFLQNLDLGDNSFSGRIPHELGQLSRLRRLNLSFNYFSGEIPASLTHCSKLWLFDLVVNELTGEIPRDIGSLTQLEMLNLGNNNLTGTLPPSLGNISSSLIYLLLQNNYLTGSIPTSFGKLSNLNLFTLGHNMLSGNIPPTLYNFSSIDTMVLADNRLTGTLPPDMFITLPTLGTLLLYGNQLQGPIPVSLSNGTNMVELDITGNNFSGTIPSNLGNHRYLYWLNLDDNELEANEESDWDFLASLTNCSYLEVLSLESNNLGSILPSSLPNLSSTLQHLAMGWNHFSGSIPDGIGNLGNLSTLSLNDNMLTGSIPPTIGKLQQLHVIALMGNQLAGKIPEQIGSLGQLNRLYLQENNLNGIIPATFGKMLNLQELNLSQNMLTGAIPKELVMLTSLSTYLDLSHNLLTGFLPSEVGKLTNLDVLNISDNKLFGEIPRTLGNCKSLEYLYMQNNFFNGTIPQSLSELKGLRELDLSVNNLSGNIPGNMGSLSGLQYLNLSYNDLEGEVPDEGTLGNADIFSILGNKNLCGGNPTLKLSSCLIKYPRKHHNSLVLKVIFIPVVGACLCLILFLVVYYVCRRLRNQQMKSLPDVSLLEGQFKKISYAELLKATDGFSQSNLIGVGSVGSVYKGVLKLEERTSVAVKVLNLQQHGASKSFMAECNVLRSIRHRNLVKIISACSSLDFSGNDFKALILEFMPNGSLEQWLHPMPYAQVEMKILTLDERFNIAIDVALALEYLHHHGETPIVHCDLKPSNILLDADMCARIGDFGIAKFISESLHRPDEHQTTSTGIKGTIGYVAPEYGMGVQASTYGDVYSYGVLLLELFSGRRPTDEMFTAGLSLHNYVEMAFPERVLDIVDSGLDLLWNDKETGANNQTDDASTEKYRCLITMIRIGLSCSRNDPRERMKMEDITKEMYSLKDNLYRSRRQTGDVLLDIVSGVSET